MPAVTTNLVNSMARHCQAVISHIEVQLSIETCAHRGSLSSDICCIINTYVLYDATLIENYILYVH